MRITCRCVSRNSREGVLDLSKQLVCVSDTLRNVGCCVNRLLTASVSTVNIFGPQYMRLLFALCIALLQLAGIVNVYK